MGEVTGQVYIGHLVSNRCTPWDMAKRVFTLNKTHPNFLKEIRQKIV